MLHILVCDANINRVQSTCIDRDIVFIFTSTYKIIINNPTNHLGFTYFYFLSICSVRIIHKIQYQLNRTVWKKWCCKLLSWKPNQWRQTKTRKWIHTIECTHLFRRIFTQSFNVKIADECNQILSVTLDLILVCGHRNKMK